MASLSVMVQHGERKKIFKIPIVKEESDIEYLQKEFKKEFSWNSEVIFQRFSKDWNEAVDLESDDTIIDKDRLIAVVCAQVSVVRKFPCSYNISASKYVPAYSIKIPQFLPLIYKC